MKQEKHTRLSSVLMHALLIFLSFLCLFFFYILIVNATRTHIDLQKGFSFLPGTNFIENFKNVLNDANVPILNGILNSLIVSSGCAILSTYFSAMTAYGLYVYDFKLKKPAFMFIMMILVMPTQVCALGFLRLITNMHLDDTL